MSELRTAGRLLRGELRRPDPLLLAMLLAVVIGVAALTSVSGFAQRVQAAIDARAAVLLGGSVQVTEQRDLRSVAAGLPASLRPAATVLELPTMASAADRLRLVELKAVDDAYPLLGELVIDGHGAQHAPATGELWVEPVLLAQLGIGIGDRIDLGYSVFTVAGTIANEPDRVAGAFSIGPRVLMNLSDLPATRLVSAQSRVRSRLLYNPPVASRSALLAQLKAALPDQLAVETAKDGIQETRDITQQATDFLRLVALAGVVLAAAAVVLATANLTERRLLTAATLKALGASQRLILLTYAGLITTVALLGGLLGAAAGNALERLLPLLLSGLIPPDLPPASFGVLPVAVLLALLVSLAVATPPLMRLGSTPPVAVLRAPSGGGGGFAGVEGWGLVLALLLCAGVYGWLSGSVDRGLVALGLLLAAAALFGLGARLLALLARRMSGAGPFAWRYATAAFGRAPMHTVLAVAALGFGVLAILAPALVEADLLRQWQLRVPVEAPNRFLIDVQPDQRDEVQRMLVDGGAQGVDLRPMVRARLSAIDGQPPKPATGMRARRYLDRENNLTWRADPEPDNPLLAGRWWSDPVANPSTPAQISAEDEWAQALGVGLGSTITFEVSGQQVTGVITSLREVHWESLRSNFFVVFSPGALDALPATYVTSYYIAPNKADALLRTLVQRYPNLTAIDLDAMTSTLQDMVSRLSRATGFLAGFTVLAGLAVLLAAVLAERSRLLTEAAVLRTLGASRRQLGTIYTLRFALLGGAAAVLGSGVALAAGAVACVRFLDIPYQPSAWPILAAILLSTALVTVTGTLGVRQVLSTPPMQSLRST